MASPLHPVLALALFSWGCGGTDAAAPSTTKSPPRALASCSGAWRQVLPDAAGVGPSALALGKSAVYFYSETQGDIRTLSTTDGSTVSLVKDGATDLWVEGSQLIFASAARLFAVPTAGGAVSTLLDGGALPAPCETPRQVLDADYFYWTSTGCAGTTGDAMIFRMPRAGGPAEQVAVLGQDVVERLALAPGAVIVAGSHSYRVPLDGRQIVPLGGTDRVAGVDRTAVYQTRETANALPVLLRAPATGDAPLPFWPDKPDTVAPVSVWPDAQGGWLVTGIEAFDDGAEHAEMWLLDEQERAHLAACDPMVDASYPGYSAYVDGRPAFATDAVYVPVKHTNTWSIAKIAR